MVMRSSRAARPRLGIVTTGHGPRPEYLEYHRRYLAALGLPDVEVVARHALEGLEGDEIDALAPEGGEPLIGGHVRAPRATGDRMGPGYREVLVARRHLIPLIQLRIDELEADGVGAIIVCCAEEYPPRSFRARIPLVLPYRSGLALVEAAAAELDRPLNVAALIPGPAWMSQDLVTWHSRPWMSSI